MTPFSRCRSRFTAAVRLVTRVLFTGASLAAAAEFQTIFDGRSLTGWDGNSQIWRVEDNAITAEIAAGAALAKNEFLYWQGEVNDFELTVEFRLSGAATANSGIQFRAQRLPDGHAAGYQADIDLGAKYLGVIYDEHGRQLLADRGKRVAIAPDGRRWTDDFATAEQFTAIAKPAGEWNTYRISAHASHVELWLNDQLCSVLDDREAAAAEFSGQLALQLHSGAGPVKVQFRNIRLAQLGRTPLPAAASAAHNAGAFTSIVPVGADGKSLNLSLETGTLDGWKIEGDAWAMQPARFAEPATPRRKTDVNGCSNRPGRQLLDWSHSAGRGQFDRTTHVGVVPGFASLGKFHGGRRKRPGTNAG
jgi:hypothetical protein